MLEQGGASDANKKVISLQHALFSNVRSGLTRPVRPVGAQKAQPHSYKSKHNENSRVMPEAKEVQKSNASLEHKKKNRSTFVKLKH